MKKTLSLLTLGVMVGGGAVKLGDAVAHAAQPIYRTHRIELLRQEAIDGGVSFVQRHRRVEMLSDGGQRSASDFHGRLTDPKDVAAAKAFWDTVVKSVPTK